MLYFSYMSDLEFVKRCVAGDKQAWGQFVDKYSRLIYNYIHEVLSIRGYPASKDNTQDIYQELFYNLIKDNFKKLSSFQGKNGCTLASWLRRVTVNFTIDHIRKLKPVVSMDEERDNELSVKDTLSNGSLSIYDIVNDAEKLADLKDCINRLDVDDKYFLELFINRRLSLEELRMHLRLTRGAVDMRKSRIVDRLKECFKSKLFKLDF
ncbi:MAG: sigma-70 family RNA polymerase sigma factor [Candidatus Omnitrophica bacterium]|nr:sigma-70 family RNA polymerase sigma factor [Candidatus Omnitrophota bacterium]